MDQLLFQIRPIWYDGSVSIVTLACMSILCIMCIWLALRLRPKSSTPQSERYTPPEKRVLPQIGDAGFEREMLLGFKRIYQRYTDPIEIETQTGEDIIPHIRDSSIQEIIIELETSLYSGQPIEINRQKELLEIFIKL